MSSLIEFHNIVKTYYMGKNKLDALKGVDLSISKGELTAIIGSSGSGKSTMMNIIGLLDRPTSGEFILNNHKVSTLSDDEMAHIRNHNIGFVFQSFFLLPRLSAIMNVALPLLYRGVNLQERKARAIAMLEKVGMGPYATHKPSELSGGQQQRVAIARALVGDPGVILADEPTGALDSKIGQEVMDLFIHLNRDEGVTIVMVTHDPKVAAQCARTIQVSDGLVISD